MVAYGCGNRIDDERRLVIDKYGNEVEFPGNYIDFMYAVYYTCGGEHPSGRKVYCDRCAIKEGLKW